MTDPFRAPTPSFSQPRTGTVGDLLNPLYARSMVTPAPYQTRGFEPNLLPGLGGQTYYTPAAAPAAVPTAKMSDFDEAGKTNMNIAPGQPESLAQPGLGLQPVDQQQYTPPPQGAPGGLELMGRSLLDSVFGFVPPDLRQHLTNGWSIVANLLDIPFEIVGNLPAVPIPGSDTPLGGFSTDPTQVFSRLPETEAKQKAEQAAANDPANALWYMSEYLRQNELELAHGLGVSPLFSDYFVPVNNLGDQVMKTLGVIGIPSRLVTEAFARSALRNIDQTVIAPAEQVLAAPDPDAKAKELNINPLIVEVVKRYKAGEITREELPTVLAKQGFGFTNDPGMDMIAEIVTDPMNVLLLAGGAAKLAGSGARLSQVGKTISLARETLAPEVLEKMDAFALGRAMDKFSQRGMTISRDDALLHVRDADRFDYLLNNTPEGQGLAQQALDSMTPRGRALVTLDPVLQKAASFVEAINSPFELPGQVAAKFRGGFRNGDRIAAFRSRASVEGLTAAYGPERLLALNKLEQSVTGNSDGITDALARASANAEVGVHRDALTRMAMANGAAPAYMPDPIVRAMSEVYHSRLAQQTEGYVRRVMSQYLPSSRLGRQGAAEVLARQRRIAAHQLHEIIPSADMERLLRWTGNADEEMLALVEHLYWGHLIGTFTAARTVARETLDKAAAAERGAVASRKGVRTKPLQERRAERAEQAAMRAQRFTPIGPKNLTYQRATAVRNAARRGDIRAVRDAVDQYYDLYDNFASRGLTDEELLRDVQIFLNELLKGGEKEGRLTIALSRDKLPASLRQWADERRDFARRAGADDPYEVGLAPDNQHRWRTVYDTDGRLVGVNPWTDVVPDKADPPGLNSLSVVRQKLFRPIRGERILEEARRNFRARAVNDYGLARTEANALFSAIRRKSAEAGTMPRGLSGSELNDLLNQMNFPEAVRQRLGTRGMASLVASAFEGDVMSVGITQKISGRAKRVGTRLPGNNWLGVVAEKLYPLARFTYNPIFLAQEAMEPFFWNILRGHKPGMRWREQDVATLQALNRAGFLGEWADQWEYSPSALLLFGQQEANRVAGPGTLIGRTWGRFIGTGRRVTSLAELKRLNYIRQVGPEFGREFKRMVEDMNPAFWDQLVREVGTADPMRVANYFWMSKGLSNPDNPFIQGFLFDSTIASALGKMARVNVNELARIHNFVDPTAMRRAVKAGTYSESDFRSAMNIIKADPGYIDRAWRVATADDPTEHFKAWADALAEAGGNTKDSLAKAKQAVAATRTLWRQLAKTLGYDEAEWLALHNSRPTRFVSSAGDLPTNARYQLAQADTIKTFYGRELIDLGSVEAKDIGREARAVAGMLPEDDIADDILAQMRAAAQPEEPIVNQGMVMGAGIDGAVGTDGATPRHIYGPGLTHDALIKMAFDVMGPDEMERAVLAHRQMAPMFDLMAKMLPDDVVFRLTNEYLPQSPEYHVNRLRVEAMEASKVLDAQGDLSYMPSGDQGEYAQNLQRPGAGNDFFSANRYDFGSYQHPTTGPANSGTYFPMGKDGHMFGWYDENGQLAATAKVVTLKMELHRATPTGTSPGGPIIRATAGQRERNLFDEVISQSEIDEAGKAAHAALLRANAEMNMDLIKSGFTKQQIDELMGYVEQPTGTRRARLNATPYGFTTDQIATFTEAYDKHLGPALAQRQIDLGMVTAPRAMQPEVALVGVDPTKQGRGLYDKLAAYVDSTGLYHWADITGRGSYMWPGAKAAAKWLAKKDAESLGLQRQALAARMMAGFSYRATVDGVGPFDALASVQAMVEAASGKHPHVGDISEQAIRDMLDFSYVAQSEFAVPNWQQRALLETMLPPGVRQADEIPPVYDALRAMGYVDSEAARDIALAQQRGFKTAGAEAVDPYEFGFVTREDYVQARDFYRKSAAQANASALLGRTDWTAADIAHLNIARYRMALRDGARNDPMTALRQRTVALNFELEPHPNSVLGDAFPNAEWASSAGVDQYVQYLNALEQVQSETARWWYSRLGEISGVSVSNVSIGPGRHRVETFEDQVASLREGIPEDEWDRLDSLIMRVQQGGTLVLGEDDQKWLSRRGFTPSDLYWSDSTTLKRQWDALGPQASIVVTGSDEAIEAAVIATGATFQRPEVVATGVDYVNEPTALREGWDLTDVTDFVLRDGALEDRVVNLIDRELLDKEWLAYNTDVARMVVVRPDGTRVIRTFTPSPAADARMKIGNGYAIPEKIESKLLQYGAYVERGRVRTYTHKVDLDEAATRRARLSDFFDEQGSFTDARGQRFDRQDYYHAGSEWREAVNYRANDFTDPWIAAAEARGFKDVVTGIRNRYRGEALAQANLSWWRHGADILDQWRAGDHLLNPAIRGYHFQLTPGRGVRGATHTDSLLDAAIFMLKGADADTAIHETLHAFVPHFEDSMVTSIAEAYAKATGKRVYRKVGPGRPTLTRAQEEWLADEFVKYVTTAKAENPALQSAFNTLGRIVKADKRYGALVEASEYVKPLFDKLFGMENVDLSAVPFNPDEYRVLAAARYMLMQGEDAAHKTHYFARGRNVLERSINHPYLGYYPASYMWGKVLPELVRFLVKEPFGIKAPFWGYAMATHVIKAVQLQLNTDQDFRDWVEGHPELIRFIQMMLPGTPWDIPVNLPAWARHAQREALRNQLRTEQGRPTKGYDLLTEAADSAGYAFGPLRFVQTLGDVKDEALKFGAPEEKPTPPRGGITPEMISAGWNSDLQDAQSTLAPLVTAR